MYRVIKRSIFLFLLLCACCQLFSTPLAHAQAISKEYFAKAKVIQVIKQESRHLSTGNLLIQTLKVQLLDGPNKGKVVTLTRGDDQRLIASQRVEKGTTVILDVTEQNNNPQYTVIDIYRLPILWILGVVFLLFIIGVAGKKGFGAVVGLFVSILVILFYIIPQILSQGNPLFVSLIGSGLILILTTYTAHGLGKQTTLAVVSTLLSLVATTLLAILSVNIARLAGLGSEDAYLLTTGSSFYINTQGLLLGGIILGTLGALNDITTTQVASMFTLKKANPKATLVSLIEYGFSIGREHIVSLVNTLVLAYAGSSLVILIFFVLNPSHLPLWVIFNNESVAEEIVRTIVGSMGLILSVPIAIILAGWWLTKE